MEDKQDKSPDNGRPSGSFTKGSVQIFTGLSLIYYWNKSLVHTWLTQTKKACYVEMYAL